MGVVAMILFVVCFSLGFGPITYIIGPELFPQKYRSKGVSIITAVGRVTSAVVATSFLSLTHLLTWGGGFLLYFGIGVVGFLFVLLFLPETRGISLRVWSFYKPESTQSNRQISK